MHAHNPWLTYGPPLHHARLFGLPSKLFDALDESPLLPAQIKEFIERLLGCDPLPEPELDPREFVSAVRTALGAVPPVFDPRSGRVAPWIELSALDRAVRARGKGGAGGCAVM